MNIRSPLLNALQLASTLLVATIALPVSAQSPQNLKPGSWEITSKLASTNDPQMDQAMAQAMKQLANMPAQQRAQMEAMMAQNGVSMPKLGPDGAMAVTVCMTPEMVAKNQLPTGQPGHCTSNNQPVAGGMNLSFSCTDPVSSGKGQVRYTGDSAFTSNMQVTSSAGGVTRQVSVEAAGRWLGACKK